MKKMKTMKKILYAEDMEECYLQTKFHLGNKYELDWKKNYAEALKAITENLKEYSAAIFDVNLDYNPNLPNAEQTRGGLDLIRIIKEKAKEQNISIPVICATSNGEMYKELALEAGADVFLWKKEFWESKGKEVLEDLVKKV